MEEKIQKILDILFPDGKYVSLDGKNETPRFVGYSYAFPMTGKTIGNIVPHIVELINYDDESINIIILPYLTDSPWKNENTDILIGNIAGIIHTVLPEFKEYDFHINEYRLVIEVNLED